MEKVALVYDKFLVEGGGERVFDVIAATYPDAPIYALSAHPKRFWEVRYNRRICTPSLSWIFRSRFLVVLFYPLACLLMWRMKVRARTVIVYSSSCGKYVRLESENRILYSNYPNRGIFELEKVVKSRLLRFLAAPFIRLFKHFEVRQFRKYSQIVSISAVSRDALKRYTGVDSSVLLCPYNDAPFKQSRTFETPRSEFARDIFLIVSRLEPEKELEYAIQAFMQSSYILRVVGVGSLFESLRLKYASANIEFTGFLSDAQLVEAIQACSAVIFPSEIEYSLVPIEANSMGKPVVALDTAASRELLVNWTEDRQNATAMFYSEKTSDALLFAARATLAAQWDLSVLQRNAYRFNPAAFQASLRLLVQ